MKNFQNEILKLPESIRSIGKVTTLGINNRLSEATSLPETLNNLNIYLGSNSESIVEEFIRSGYPHTITSLCIGDSSDSQNYGRDYRNISKLLSKTSFPNLKNFELGVWELLYNEHCLYGKLGNITAVLQSMPDLETLTLCGSFTLDSPINLYELKEIIIKLDDDTTGINGGYISQETLTNLLNSTFPSLKEAYLDLDLEILWTDDYKRVEGNTANNQNYIFSDSFLQGKSWNGLKKIELSGGYAIGELEKLEDSNFVVSNDIAINFYDYAFI